MNLFTKQKQTHRHRKEKQVNPEPNLVCLMVKNPTTAETWFDLGPGQRPHAEQLASLCPSRESQHSPGAATTKASESQPVFPHKNHRNEKPEHPQHRE